MLNILWLSFFGAIIGGLPSWVSFAVNHFKDPDANQRSSEVLRAIFGSISGFVITLAYLYNKCDSQIFLTVFNWWLCVVLLVYCIILLFSDVSNLEFLLSLVLLVVSFLIFLSVSLLAPTQTLVYIHDAKDIDVTYTVSSDEILAKVELSIFNEGVRDKYYIDTSEMRKIAEKDLAVYHINNFDGSGSNLSEYIPGYAIKEEGQTPQLVSKRLYFDTSYLGKKDALRTVRRVYPTLCIGDHKFDIDDNYNPYQIYAYRENLFTSDGKDYGIITLNLRDGTVTKYPADKVPSWVDFKSTYPR